MSSPTPLKMPLAETDTPVSSPVASAEGEHKAEVNPKKRSAEEPAAEDEQARKKTAVQEKLDRVIRSRERYTKTVDSLQLYYDTMMKHTKECDDELAVQEKMLREQIEKEE